MCAMWVLGIEPTSTGAASALPSEPIFLFCFTLCLMFLTDCKVLLPVFQLLELYMHRSVSCLTSLIDVGYISSRMYLLQDWELAQSCKPEFNLHHTCRKAMVCQRQGDAGSLLGSDLTLR